MFSKPASSKQQAASLCNIRDAITLWLNKGLDELSDEQVKEYKKPINCHFIPFFGEMTFADLTPEVIREFCSARYAYADKEKGPMSAKRLKATMTAFKTIWNFIVKEREWQEILVRPSRTQLITSTTCGKKSVVN